MKTNDQRNHIYIAVKVIPNASKDAIEGWEEDRLKVRIHGIPEKGKANKILIGFLADQLGISKSQLSIQSGETSRLKRIRIEGVSDQEVRNKLS